VASCILFFPQLAERIAAAELASAKSSKSG